MVKAVFMGIALVTAVGSAFGAGSIVSSFQSPFYASYPKGMDYYGGYIYHVSNANTTCYQTTTTGSIVRSMTFPGSMRGVHFTGSYFWASNDVAVFRLDTSGSVLNSFSTAAARYGLTFDGTYIWGSTAISPNLISKMTTAGSILASFVGPGTFNGGLDYADGYLWVADWPASGAGIYRITTTGSVVESYRPVPGGYQTPGVCWDGNYVWFNDYATPRYVYRMTTVITNLVPASLGKIKSIYR
jgi:hypothetical protein